TEGGRVAEIDVAMQRFGMAWGPFLAMDEAGLDVLRASLRGLKAVYGPEFTPPALIKRLTKRGWLGRKSGAGFYVHGDRELRVHAEALPRPAKRAQVQDGVVRLVARFVNAAFAAVGLQLNDAGLVALTPWRSVCRFAPAVHSTSSLHRCNWLTPPPLLSAEWRSTNSITAIWMPSAKAKCSLPARACKARPVTLQSSGLAES